MTEKPNPIILVFITMGVLALLLIIAAAALGGFDPHLIADKTVTPSSHALYGIVTTLPGNGTYCINAETLSRGKPVSIGLHYIIQEPIAPDRFGSTRNSQRGEVFIADDNHIVNETVVVPEGATDAIVTVSYQYYVDTNRVHIVVRKCEPYHD